MKCNLAVLVVKLALYVRVVCDWLFGGVK